MDDRSRIAWAGWHLMRPPKVGVGGPRWYSAAKRVSAAVDPGRGAEKGVGFCFEDRQIENVAKLLCHLTEDRRRLSEAAGREGRPPQRVWFRGLESASYELVPTFHRRGISIGDEIYMMNLFKQNAHEFVGRIPRGEWEWMFLMRHHGLPSRLLDWTESPLVGLFFAVSSDPPDKEAEADAVMWCLLPTVLNQTSLGWPADSDSLPMFTDDKTEFTLGENEGVVNYLPSSMRLAATDAASPSPAAGISVRTTRRIQAQLGVFTIHHADAMPLERAGDGQHVWRYLIPARQKQGIRDELRTLGVVRRTVLPDLDNVARDASESLGGR